MSDAISQWRAKQPQYSRQRLISETLMGNPKARAMITGGTEQTLMRWDAENKQYEVIVNELGYIVRAIESRTGCDIGPTEYIKRRVQ